MTRKTRALLFGTALAGSVLILLLNLCVPSLLNFYFWSSRFVRWESFIAHIFDLHANWVGPFVKRPVTTFFIDQFHQFSGVSYWWSFLVVQGFLLMAAAYALGNLSLKLTKDLTSAVCSQVVFFLSFSVLFAFVTPNDVYDEFTQYLFLFLALLYLAQKHYWLLATFFFLSLLTRESSMLLLPGFLLLDRRVYWKIGLTYGIPLLIYFAFSHSLEAPGDPNRWIYWSRNFESLKVSAETLISSVLALGIPLGILWATYRSGLASLKDPWVKAFGASLVLNTLIVFLATYARESRLLALPLVFLWPLTGLWLTDIYRGFQAKNLYFKQSFLHLTIIVALTVAAQLFYHPNYRSAAVYRVTLSIYAILILLPLTLTRKNNLN